MRIRQIVRAVILLALFCCPMEARSIDKKEYDVVVPKDAQSIVSERIGLSDQVLFSVTRKYPSFAFSDGAIARLEKVGWKRCTSESAEWTSFVDMASGNAIRVHQKVLHLKLESRLLVLIGRYSSPATGSQSNQRVAPTSDRQTGNLIAITGSSAELDEALKMFNARC